MKKFVALFLAMVLVFSLVPAAFAAENCTNPTTTTENARTFESVRVAVTSDGKLAAIKTLKGGYSTLKGYKDEAIENIASVLKSGGILRAKGLIKGSLDENCMFADGSTSVQLALEVVNLEELQLAVGDGVEINAVVVMDAASIAHDGHIGHRAIDRPTNLVAKFHQKNGSVLFVYYDEFDGQQRLVFDAEAVQVTTGGTTTGGNTTGGTTTGGNTTGGTTTGGNSNSTDFTIGGDTTTGGTTNNSQNTNFTIGGETSNDGGTTSGTTTNNQGTHSGWSDALTGGKTTESTGKTTGFTIDD